MIRQGEVAIHRGGIVKEHLNAGGDAPIGAGDVEVPVCGSTVCVDHASNGILEHHVPVEVGREGTCGGDRRKRKVDRSEGDAVSDEVAHPNLHRPRFLNHARGVDADACEGRDRAV